VSELKITRPGFDEDIRVLQADELAGVDGGLSMATEAALKTSVSSRRLRVGDPGDPIQVAGALLN
jgi:hypothetical protein